MKPPILLPLAVLSVTQAAEPTHTLKLACYGTASTGQWIDMNITVDFAARTVAALDLSKIEAGQLTLSLSDYSLRSVIQTAFSAVEPSGEGETASRLKIEVATGATAKRYGDERRLDPGAPQPRGQRNQIHRQPGRCRSKARYADGSFNVAVRDTGPGISERRSGQAIPGVPAGRQFDYAQEGRYRAGAGDLEAHHRDAWGKDIGRIGRRPRLNLCLHTAGQGRAPGQARLINGEAYVSSWPILLQKSLIVSSRSDLLVLMRFAAETDDDGSAQSRSRAVVLFILS